MSPSKDPRYATRVADSGVLSMTFIKDFTLEDVSSF
jgi:hypothetical protein